MCHGLDLSSRRNTSERRHNWQAICSAFHCYTGENCRRDGHGGSCTRRIAMNKGVLFLGGLGLGAGLMYFLDPTYGKRRRIVARDQLLGVTNDISECMQATWTDVAQRAQGFAAETSALCSADQASDSVIEARVRAKMGHCVSHPHAIHVSVENGR